MKVVRTRITLQITSAVIMLTWLKERSQKIDDLPVLVTYWSGTLPILSSRVNGPIAQATLKDFIKSLSCWVANIYNV